MVQSQTSSSGFGPSMTTCCLAAPRSPQLEPVKPGTSSLSRVMKTCAEATFSAAIMQVVEHPEFSTPLSMPLSHCSPSSCTPLPHTAWSVQCMSATAPETSTEVAMSHASIRSNLGFFMG